MALWANLHGSFMFGLALALFLAAEAVLAPGRRAHEARRWAGFSLLAFAAALLTPNGMAGFFEPVRLIAMPALQASFGEWLSPNFQRLQPLEIWLLGIIALGFTTGVRLPLSRLLLLLALCHMALGHARHAELLGLVGPLAVAATLGPPIAARIRSMPVSALSRAAAGLAVPAAPPAVRLILAISFALSLPLLLWPIERAAELYGNAFLDGYLAAERGDEPALTALLARYGITWTLLSAQQGAVSRLDALPGWRRVYTDTEAVIHMRVARPSS
jgi:hypothetical protein